jgi:quercetin 2,3-dioxygenase
MITQNRRIAQIITAQNTSDGAGVKLKRVINPQRHPNLDPFILLDEFGSDEAADYIGGFPPHPHRGFETVTYMLEGAMLHRDHLGNEGHLAKGGVQWMTAAHGIIHSEMPEQEDGLLHGFQLWLNLPAKEKMSPPHYKDYAANEIPQLNLANGSGTIKLIAGEFDTGSEKITGAVAGVSTQPLYFDLVLTANKQLDIPISPDHTTLVYVYDGELAIGAGDNSLQSGQLAELVDGNNIRLITQNKPAKCLVLAAKPLNEPMVQSGPFVMNSQAEIDQAYRDYRDGVLTQ